MLEVLKGQALLKFLLKKEVSIRILPAKLKEAHTISSVKSFAPGESQSAEHKQRDRLKSDCSV